MIDIGIDDNIQHISTWFKVSQQVFKRVVYSHLSIMVRVDSVMRQSPGIFAIDW